MWTAEITNVVKNPGNLTVSVIYKVSNGIETKTITENLVSNVSKEAIWRLAQDRADDLNKIDAQIEAVIDLDTSPIIGKVDFSVVQEPPAPDLNLPQFRSALNQYRKVKAAFGISKTVTQQNVTDAYDAMKLLYKDGYEIYLITLL